MKKNKLYIKKLYKTKKIKKNKKNSEKYTKIFKNKKKLKNRKKHKIKNLLFTMSNKWEDQDDKTLSVDLSLSSRTKKLSQTAQITGEQYTNKLRDLYSSFYSTS